MGFAKFFSPRRIKLARGTARDFKLQFAAVGTAKFSFTLEGLHFAGNLDLKRDGLYLPIREGDELAVIYEDEALGSNFGDEALGSLNSCREDLSDADLSGENSVPRPSHETPSSGNSAALGFIRKDLSSSLSLNSTRESRDGASVNSTASALPLDFVNISLGAQRWKDAGSTALAAIFAAFGVALAAMSIYCIIFIFEKSDPAVAIALPVLMPSAYCSFKFMRRDWCAAKFGRIFAALAHSKEPKRSGEAEGYASGVRVLRSDDIYYFGFALDGVYLSGENKLQIVSSTLRADQNLEELADGENYTKFKNLDAENSANSANAANSINSASSAEAAVLAKAKDASQSFELQNGDILRARYKDYRVSGLWNQSRGMKLGDTRSGLRRAADFIAAVALQLGLRLGGGLVLTWLGDYIGGFFGNALSFIGFLLLLSLML